MTDIQSLLQPDRGQAAIALHLLDRKSTEPWLKSQPERIRQAALAQGFEGKGYQLAIITDEQGGWAGLLGVADAQALGPWCLAKAAESLPEGVYRVAGGTPGPAVLGWLLGQYRFDNYLTKGDVKGARILLTDDPARIEENVWIAQSTFLVRDLVNLPASDLGPAELGAAIEAAGTEFGGRVRTTVGDALASGFPMVAAVGRAAAPGREPRLVELLWGDQRHPRVAIVGKGVCFDSGGLDIKPSAGMRLMKKDMGGAAHALALARLVMKANLPIRLHLVVPAVENAVSGAAFRPGDVLRSRKGLSVEVGNTDAEGRLVLADALVLAGEESPEMMLDFATLTGAARIALGPDLPALFANDDQLATDLLDSGKLVSDPLWRMPLWQPYQEMLSSDVADLGNVADSPLAGAVTAALFLQRFVPEGMAWAHFDTFAWRLKAKPGRPKGGDALGLRSAWQMLQSRYRR